MQAVSGKSMNTDKILQLIHVYSFLFLPQFHRYPFFFFTSVSVSLSEVLKLYLFLYHIS